MMKFSNNKIWNARMEFISDIFHRNCNDNEEITVNANYNEIDIRYNRVANKKHVSIRTPIPPELMCNLHDGTVSAICCELLMKWRKEES